MSLFVKGHNFTDKSGETKGYYHIKTGESRSNIGVLNDCLCGMSFKKTVEAVGGIPADGIECPMCAKPNPLIQDALIAAARTLR